MQLVHYLIFQFPWNYRLQVVSYSISSLEFLEQYPLNQLQQIPVQPVVSYGWAGCCNYRSKWPAFFL